MAHAVTHSGRDGAERAAGEDREPVPAPSAAPEQPSLVLRRLLGVATLTPEQAVYVASQMLRGLASLHETGLVHGQLDTDCIVVSADGGIAVQGWGVGAGDPTTSDVQVDHGAVRQIISELARNADRPVARRRPTGAALLDALERCRMDGTVGLALADQLDAALAAALGNEDGLDLEQIRSEVGALIRTFIAPRRAVSTPPAPALPDAAASAEPDTVATAEAEAEAVEPLPTASVLVDQRNFRTRLYLVAGAAVAALGVVIGVTIAQSGGGTTTAAQTPAPTPPAQTTHPSAKPSNALRPLGVNTPFAAGAIKAVKLHAHQACRPGESCTVRVTVRISAGQLAQLSWKLRAIDRCTGRSITVQRGVMVAEPSWMRVYTDISVAVPRGHAVSLVAMTSSPDRAASHALTVPSGVHSC